MFMLFVLVVLFVIVCCFLGFKQFFLRNPDRTNKEHGAILSPADGKIIAITSYSGNTILSFNKGNQRYKGTFKTLSSHVSSDGYAISIFMSIFNVHYNRIPCDGTVTLVKHTNGRFLPANSLKAILQNEKTETIIVNKDFTIKVIQVAGFIARRIETFVNRNDKVRAGQLLGLIKFGSQVTILLPSNVKLDVNVGDKVKAGESIIARPT